jgi:hypothetical protein
MSDIDTTNEKVNQIIAKLKATPLTIGFREFSREEYKQSFPEGIIKTPLGIVKLGAHQFEKMEKKGRKGLVAAMFFTLNDPIFIFSEKTDAGEARIYIRSFRELGFESQKVIYVMSVVVDIEGQAIAISTGKRKEKQIIQKIKLARSILYEKERAPSPTIGTGS